MELQFNVMDEAVLSLLRKHPAKAKRHLTRGLDRAALEIQRDAQRNTPKMFSTLWASIHIKSPSLFSRVIEPGVAYGRFIEKGTRPGYMPPLDALKPWVNQMAGRGLSDEDLRDKAFGLAMHIKAHGTKAHPFMQPAFEAAEKSSLLMRYTQAAVKAAIAEAGG